MYRDRIYTVGPTARAASAHLPNSPSARAPATPVLRPAYDAACA